MVPGCRPLLVPLLVAALLAGLAAPLAAAPVLGPQIQVNASTRDVNTFPQVAVFPDGGFIVVWTATPQGRGFRVSLPAAPGQDPPALAAGGANAVAVWAEESTSMVYVRVITP